MIAPANLASSAHEELATAHARLCGQALKINMSRGVPGTEQLDLAEAFLALPGAKGFTARDGSDGRNYGGLQGLPEVRELLAGPLLGLPAEQVAIGENSSLALMHEAITNALLHGVPGSPRPWSKEPFIRFICPVPGYDRHFAICEEFGIQLVPVAMDEHGPDMDRVEALVAADSTIKGMWCVPKYSNPTGAIYSDAVVQRLASMPTAAMDFRLFWDNAYGVHHLTDARPANQDITGLSARAGYPDRAFIFASTSKVLLPGAGLALFGSSPNNLTWWLARRAVRTIGPDKLNQLRHLHFFGDVAGLERHMSAQQALLAPRFECVHRVFSGLFAPGEATWTQPAGGYFISLDVAPGCARRTVELARQAGIVLTPAGAPFPGGHDPEDKNLRIAPTCVDLATLAVAAEAIVLCAQLAAAQIS